MYRPDAPENCRLFILAGKGLKEDEFKEKFGQYGKMEDLWIVKDKRTNEDKGVVYITFSKASEAALAMEEMNGKTLGSNPKPIKVLIANTKRDGSVRDPREDEKYVRLFVIIPKSFKEEDLRKEFEKYGDLASVDVLRDRDSGANKGFGYVRYHRPYHAALALENCDRTFKPKFAEPKKPVTETEDRYVRDRYDRHHDRAPGGYPYGDRDRDRDRDRGMKRGFDDYGDRDGRRDRREDYIADDGRSRYSVGPAHDRYDDREARRMRADQETTIYKIPSHKGDFSRASIGSMSPIDLVQDYSHSNCQRLHITAPLGLTQTYLSKLFNLIPGLEYCDLNEQTGIAYARYKTPQCASYARDKLDQFEYPIGSRLIVRYADSPVGGPDLSGPSRFLTQSGFDQLDTNPVHQAAMVLEKAGINPELILSQTIGLPLDKERVTYCSIPLPLPKPLVSDDNPVAQRLFIVCQPAAVPERILRDAFSRFGNLIDVYLLPGRNFGYAKFAHLDAAAAAMETLHGQTVAGQRLKVLEAEPQRNDEDGNKRQKTEFMK